MRTLAIAAFAIGVPLVAQSSAREPTASIADAQSLSQIISFAPLEPVLKNFGPSKILWRVNLALPGHLALKRAHMMGYVPMLEMNDGRCFGMDFNGASDKLIKVSLSQAPCLPHEQIKAAPPAPPKAGLTYIGKAWNLNAWRDSRSGQTMLVPDRGTNPRTILQTSMGVIAVGGMGAPDAPMTEVSLVGYVHNQLVVSTVMLILP